MAPSMFIQSEKKDLIADDLLCIGTGIDFYSSEYVVLFLVI